MKVVELENSYDVELLHECLESWEALNNVVNVGLPTPTWGRVTQTLNRLAANPNAVLLALQADNKLVGFMGGYVVENHFCETKICNECFWFVIPEYRNYAKRLLNGLKQWAKAKGCSHITVNTSLAANVNFERVSKLLSRCKLEPYECVHIGEL